MFDDIDQALPPGRKRRRFCGFSKWARTLAEADRATAERLVAGDEYNCRALARYFQAKGAAVSDQMINRHRNGRCCGQVR